MSRTKPQISITGRDGYIVGKALAYAIATIQTLPSDRQEFSDMLDMCRIAIARSTPFLPSHISSVFAHTGIRVNLWPNGGWLDYEHPPLSSMELHLKNLIEQHLNQMALLRAANDDEKTKAVTA